MPSERKCSAPEKKPTDTDASVDPSREKWSGFRMIDMDKVFSAVAIAVAELELPQM